MRSDANLQVIRPSDPRKRMKGQGILVPDQIDHLWAGENGRGKMRGGLRAPAPRSFRVEIVEFVALLMGTSDPSDPSDLEGAKLLIQRHLTPDQITDQMTTHFGVSDPRSE